MCLLERKEGTHGTCMSAFFQKRSLFVLPSVSLLIEPGVPPPIDSVLEQLPIASRTLGGELHGCRTTDIVRPLSFSLLFLHSRTLFLPELVIRNFVRQRSTIVPKQERNEEFKYYKVTFMSTLMSRYAFTSCFLVLLLNSFYSR